jgi:hypothetical protein
LLDSKLAQIAVRVGVAAGRNYGGKNWQCGRSHSGATSLERKFSTSSKRIGATFGSGARRAAVDRGKGFRGSREGFFDNPAEIGIVEGDDTALKR